MINVAVLGAGRIARLAHLPAWSSVRGATVTHIVDADPVIAAEAAREFGVPSWGCSVDEVAAHEDIDAVDICTPASTHVELASVMLNHGKHVLVEKPPALDVDGCEKLAKAASQQNLVCAVAENWMCSGAFARARRALECGDIGSPIIVQGLHASPFWIDTPGEPPPDPDGLGYFFAAGSHTVHVARAIAGDLDEVMCYTVGAKDAPLRQPEAELVLAGRFESGAVASFVFAGRSRHLGPRKLWFRVVGTEGVLEFDVWSDWLEVTRNGHMTRSQNDLPNRGFQHEFDDFISAIASGATPGTPVSQYLGTLATIRAGYRSMSAGHPVSVASTANGPVAAR